MEDQTAKEDQSSSPTPGEVLDFINQVQKMLYSEDPVILEHQAQSLLGLSLKILIGMYALIDRGVDETEKKKKLPMALSQAIMLSSKLQQTSKYLWQTQQEFDRWSQKSKKNARRLQKQLSRRGKA